MYENFYGLSASPFQLTPDARFFYESTVHRQAMAYLVYGLHHADGFVVITGEVGAGKTILVDNLLSTIDQSNFVIAKIVTTQLAGDDLLHLVAAGYGIAKEGLAKGALLQRITDFVLAQQRNGRRVLLILWQSVRIKLRHSVSAEVTGVCPLTCAGTVSTARRRRSAIRRGAMNGNRVRA